MGAVLPTLGLIAVCGRFWMRKVQKAALKADDWYFQLSIQFKEIRTRIFI